MLNWRPGVAAAVLVIAVGLAVVVGLRAILVNNLPTSPTSTLLVATPAAAKPLSPLATQSAFLSLEARIASLSSALDHYQAQDPKLTPPSLELSLGIPK